ncbi:patatin [Shewanella sp. OPT22]|nr:patatin [Shewanella sp. OPT22]
MSEKTALVLGGGGARAAYQVGVFKAIVQNYPRNHNIPFEILSGSSAGAINATSLATHASCFHLAVKKLEYVWGHFTTDKIYKSSITGVTSHLIKMALKGLQANSYNPGPGSLFNNDPLRDLLNSVMDFKRIDRNIDLGALTALAIDVSCYNDSKSITFFQAKPEIENWSRARRKGIRGHLYTHHLLASSAIPLAFPTVRLRRKYYGDGSVHQLSPLSSPIHLGANKLLVINLDSHHKHKDKRLKHHPTTAAIAGHLLDTIFSDTLNSDLERLQRINNTINLIPESQRAEYPLRNIDTLVLKPSEDLGEIAAQYYSHMPFAVRMLLRGFGVNQYSESSVISYLLFEKAYTKALMNLGYKDTLPKLDEIYQFLGKND